MHGLAPRVILGRAWWEATRQSAYRTTNYHCAACGVHKLKAKYRQWLEAHEVYEIDYLLGKMKYLEAVPLCHCCHNYIHSGRLAALLDEGKVSQAKYAAIIQHGDRVLQEAGLTKEVDVGPTVDWADWRLVLNGREHPPKYKTLEQWNKAFQNDIT